MIVRGRPQYKPRVKTVDGIDYDIANITFSELPQVFRTSNIDAAKFACGLVQVAIDDGVEIDNAFLNRFVVWNTSCAIIHMQRWFIASSIPSHMQTLISNVSPPPSPCNSPLDF